MLKAQKFEKSYGNLQQPIFQLPLLLASQSMSVFCLCLAYLYRNHGRDDHVCLDPGPDLCDPDPDLCLDPSDPCLCLSCHLYLYQHLDHCTPRPPRKCYKNCLSSNSNKELIFHDDLMMTVGWWL